MHPMLQRQVDSNFMTEKQAEMVQAAIDNKETVIASGHRSSGIRPLLASLMMIANQGNETVQIKELDDITNDVDYILLPGLGVDNFDEFVQKAFEATPPMITIKEPEHPYSMMRVMNQAAKNTGNRDKQVWLLECRKTDDDQPIMVDVQRIHYNEKGRVTIEKNLREDE